jgi:hypothetical protein
MKKLFFTLILGTLFLSCSSDDSSGSSLSNTPEAKPEFDNSLFGIYKGVFVGSSGNILVNINNEGEVFAELVIDGNKSTYTTSDSVTEDFVDVTFSNGSSSFGFFVDNFGPSVYNLSIIGHPNANIVMMKEYSDALVECYQGTFNGDDSGAFNLIVSDGEISGLAKSNGDDSSISLSGFSIGNSMSGTFDGGSFTGTKNGNNISGDWENDFAESGSWSGKRKL